MPGFIHGEVNWLHRADAIKPNLRSMIDAVAGYPWASTDLEEVSAHSPSCVVGVQLMHDVATRRDRAAQAVVVAADIQVHGRDDLLSKLEMSATEAAAIGDEGLIAAAYQQWGIEFADHLVGDGALAIWDPARKRMICWRDAAGVRPLYFHHQPGKAFVFSSDLQSLAAHPGVQSRLDLEYTNSFLRNEQFQHPTRTLLYGVEKLRAGHVLVMDASGLRIHRFWDPRSFQARREGDDRALAEELLELLRSVVGERLEQHRNDVAAHLSGGLDSSSVALTASAMLDDGSGEIRAFSWSPPREVVPAMGRDERDLVEAAADFGAIRPRYTTLTPENVVDVAYRDVALRPRATLNFEVATSRAAAESGARMILSGWGGDEMIAFNGRGYFADLARRGRWIKLERELRLRSQIQGGTVRGAWKSRVFMPLSIGWAVDEATTDRASLPAELRPEFAELLSSVRQLENEYPRERPGVHRMQADLFDFGHLQYRMESWAAHGASMGIVYSFPLLDRRVMEFALSITGSMFFRDGWKRWLYRKAMEGVLPDLVRWNAMKYDDAAQEHLRAVLNEKTDIYRTPLRDHQDNPLVDVSVILAEQDRLQQAFSTDGNSNSHPSRHIGAGAWLAFTRLLPP